MCDAQRVLPGRSCGGGRFRCNALGPDSAPLPRAVTSRMKPTAATILPGHRRSGCPELHMHLALGGTADFFMNTFPSVLLSVLLHD
jgi:hypothetical protein